MNALHNSPEIQLARKYPDYVLLWKEGDDYALYGDDFHEHQQQLTEAPTIERFISDLIKSGQKVAVVEHI